MSYIKKDPYRIAGKRVDDLSEDEAKKFLKDVMRRFLTLHQRHEDLRERVSKAFSLK